MTAPSVDLRSDTVTRPDAGMREAMARAEVGDDVFGEDPTVNRLEREAAHRTGHEAGLFVPSGTMGNEIALNVHASAGTEVICEAESHVFHYELAGMARLSGLMPRPIPGERGLLSADQVELAIAPDAIYRARTGLVTLENTAMSAGGLAGRPEPQREVAEVCRRHGLPIHLDGGRVFNAAAALDLPVNELTGFFDSVMFSLSKGLGAPAGSVLCGSREFIDEARRVRKLFGGGMRQVGILAAAGLIALERGAASLLPDHANARKLAEALAGLPGLAIEPDRVETNIVVVEVDGDGDPAGRLVAALEERGVLAVPLDRGRVRFVTHRDVDAGGIDRAIDAIREILS
ncbi:MAG: threonine aldolase family protein [Thermoanaerobaculia bacterium]